jgi:hypothetical protein
VPRQSHRFEDMDKSTEEAEADALVEAAVVAKVEKDMEAEAASVANAAVEADVVAEDELVAEMTEAAAVAVATAEQSVVYQSTGHFWSRHRDMFSVMLHIIARSRQHVSHQRRVRIDTKNLLTGETWETMLMWDVPDVLATVRKLAKVQFASEPGCTIAGVHLSSWWRPGQNNPAVPLDAYVSGLSDAKYQDVCIDIDLTDYDPKPTLTDGAPAAETNCGGSTDVRPLLCACAGTARICRVCVWLLHAAVRVVTTMLREQFGYTLVLCVFSGRRGVHVRVLDPSAVALSREAREALTRNLSCPLTRAKQPTYVYEPTVYHDQHVKCCMPFFERAFIVEKTIAASRDTFRRFLSDCHAIWKPDAKGVTRAVRRDKIVDAVLDDFVRSSSSTEFVDGKVQNLMAWTHGAGFGAVATAAAASSTSLRVWQAFRKLGLRREILCAATPYTSDALGMPSLASLWHQMRMSIECWVLSRFLPRLDLNVTKDPSHQMRMPWTLHTVSNRPVLPFDHDGPRIAPVVASALQPLFVAELSSIIVDYVTGVPRVSDLLNFADETPDNQRRALAEAKSVTTVFYQSMCEVVPVVPGTSSLKRKTTDF